MRSAFRSFLLLRNQSQHPFHQVPSESIWCVWMCGTIGWTIWMIRTSTLSRRTNELYNFHSLWTLIRSSIGKPCVSPYAPIRRHDGHDTFAFKPYSALYSGCFAESVCIYFKRPESAAWFLSFPFLMFPIFFFKLLLWDSPPFGVYFQIYKEQILSLRFSYFDWWGFGKGAGHCGLISVKLWKSIFCKLGVCLGVKEDFIKKTLLPLETLETTLYLKRRRHRQTNVWF